MKITRTTKNKATLYTDFTSLDIPFLEYVCKRTTAKPSIYRLLNNEVYLIRDKSGHYFWKWKEDDYYYNEEAEEEGLNTPEYEDDDFDFDLSATNRTNLRDQFDEETFKKHNKHINNIARTTRRQLKKAAAERRRKAFKLLPKQLKKRTNENEIEQWFKKQIKKTNKGKAFKAISKALKKLLLISLI